ncbi:hypothetical protein ABC977_13415 [Thioalkalicoccus limnaeus]|uniref:Uncharacterized protein n=1 Tax=Thioalkalicoccus limnaeus TaxID=120681 RepID=A0ABV4BFT2_9GAMM
MSGALYDAHPSLIRTRPVGILIAFAIVAAGGRLGGLRLLLGSRFSFLVLLTRRPARVFR